MIESPTPKTASAARRTPAAGSVPLSRRALFTGASAALSVLKLREEPADARPDPPEVSADVDPGSLLPRLVRRATFGFTMSELALATSLGYNGYVEYQLNPGTIDDSALNTRLATLSTLTMSFNELTAMNNINLVMNELTEATILRAVLSRRQLFERVVEFWNDHFNIDINNDGNVYLNPAHDRLVIRPNALGRFGDLLMATARSPAMLYYLNNDISTFDRPNENYARELLELHTLGTDSGYTQQDVHEVARCFTGWTWWRRNAGDLNGTFYFDGTVHDDGEKLVLGHVIPRDGGEEDGIAVLNILANHPATATFIARKICHRFVGENCTQGVIDHVAGVYRQTNGNVSDMLRAALLANVQADAPPKYKRPFHQIVSALRALPANIISTAGLRDQLDAAGHRPFFWSTPDGYPDTLAYWSGLVIARWNFGAALMQNHIPGVGVDYATFFSNLTTADQMADRINMALLNGELPAADRDVIRDYLLPDPPSTTRQREAIGLAIGSPAFQWH